MFTGIGNSNRYIILGIISILMGLAVYFAMSKIGADEQYAALHISISGVQSIPGHTTNRNMLGTFEIIKPDGTKIDLGSGGGIYDDNPIQKFDFMTPGTGYKVNFTASSELDTTFATYYKLDPTVANNTNSRTVDLAANQTTVVNFAVTLVNGDFRPLAKFEGTEPAKGEKIADITVVDRDGKSYSATWLNQDTAPTFSVPPGSVTATLTNINSKLALKPLVTNSNPRTTIVHSYDGQSSDFVFIDATSSSASTQSTASPSPTASASPTNTTAKSAVKTSPTAKTASSKSQVTASPSKSSPDVSLSSTDTNSPVTNSVTASRSIYEAKHASSTIPPVAAGVATTIVSFLVGFVVLSRFKPS